VLRGVRRWWMWGLLWVLTIWSCVVFSARSIQIDVSDPTYPSSIEPSRVSLVEPRLPSVELLEEVQTLKVEGRQRRAAFLLGERLGLSRETLQLIVSDDITLEPSFVEAGQHSPNLNSSTAFTRLEPLRELEYTVVNVAVLHQFGEVLTNLGSLGAARRVLEYGLAMSQQLSEQPLFSELLVSLGNVHRTLGKRYEGYGRPAHSHFTTAAEFYRQAIRVPGSDVARRRAQLNLLSLLVETPIEGSVQELLAQLWLQLTLQPPSRDAAIELLNFAYSLTCLKLQTLQVANPPEGETFGVVSNSRSTEPEYRPYQSPLFRDCYVASPHGEQLAEAGQSPISFEDIALSIAQAIDLARSFGDRRSEAYALGQLGELYELAGDREGAERLTRSALAIARSIEAWNIAYRWQWQLGRLLERSGDRLGALEAYRSAVETLQWLRGDLSALNRDVQYDFRDEVEPVYREWVGLLLASESPTPEELRQAQDAIEALQLAELDNFFGDACSETVERSIEDLDAQASAVYTIVLPDGLHLILSVPNAPLRHYRSPLPQEGMETFVEIIRQSLANDFLWQQPLEQAYDMLFRPLERDLSDRLGTTVAFVLDGALQNLPVSVLYDGEKFLVEKYSIAIAPGLQLLDMPASPPGGFDLLAAGRSSFSQIDLTSLPQFAPTNWTDLPYVEEELREISSIVNAQLLFEEAFKSDRLEAAVRDRAFTAIHIATHAQFDTFAENTFVLAWDRPLTLDRLAQILHQNVTRHRHALELLVLSACETAEGNDRTVLGFAGMGIRVGAHSTVGSLWNVNDRSTARLMTQFYRHLKEIHDDGHINKAEALRQAQLDLLTDDRFASPYYWGPFVLVGNWR